ncbi:hypothetical protein F4679DRAFT_572016 [Xylaria curta]|nr:hypothetical protein F4679DRAFT_572016 [Xylaria curta]
MLSRQEFQVSSYEKSSTSTSKKVTKSTAAPKQARPSVNVKLAQNYRKQEDLPPIERGSPRLRFDENLSSQEAEDIQIPLGESSREAQRRTENTDDGPPRDYVTGRMLSEYGRSCLRCTEKGLRCTFNFVGKENEPQCVACRRSKEPYCIRFRPPKTNKKSIPFNGPPWKNPNFVAGTAEDGKTARLTRSDLENLLCEFYHGESGYVLGNYVAERDMSNYVLPPFNGGDLPIADRPKNYETMDWKDVLPDWRNRSLRPQKGEGDEEREKQKTRLAMARKRSLNPNEEEGEGEKKLSVLMMEVAGKSENDDQIRFLRIMRRYSPREQNLSDILGETW